MQCTCSSPRGPSEIAVLDHARPRWSLRSSSVGSGASSVPGEELAMPVDHAGRRALWRLDELIVFSDVSSESLIMPFSRHMPSRKHVRV